MVIVEKKNIICFNNRGKIYFIKNSKLCRAFRKHGINGSFGTLKNLRSKISIKDKTIVELGIIEMENINNISNREKDEEEKQ